ncbi:hypothetical protein ABEY50_27195 [Priestia megaterium]
MNSNTNNSNTFLLANDANLIAERYLLSTGPFPHFKIRWIPIAGGGTEMSPFIGGDNRAFFRITYINYLNVPNDQIIQNGPWNKRYILGLYNIWGVDLFRFVTVNTINLNTPLPTQDEINNSDFNSFINSRFANSIDAELKALSGANSPNNSDINNIFVVLLPLSGIPRTSEKLGVKGASYAITDPKKLGGLLGVTYLFSDSDPDIFAHEFGHIMFSRFNAQGYVTEKNPYDEREWVSLSKDTQKKADSDAVHSYIPGNLMQPNLMNPDGTVNTQLTYIQKTKAYYSPLAQRMKA